MAAIENFGNSLLSSIATNVTLEENEELFWKLNCDNDAKGT